MITTMIGMAALTAGLVDLLVIGWMLDPAFEEAISEQAPAACRDRWIAENVSPFEVAAPPVSLLRTPAYLAQAAARPLLPVMGQPPAAIEAAQPSRLEVLAA